MDTKMKQSCISVCMCYQCSPGDLWYPIVSSSEVNYKQTNGQKPAWDGNKHHPAERRQMIILCAPHQDPHHHATHLEERRESQDLLQIRYLDNSGSQRGKIDFFSVFLIFQWLTIQFLSKWNKGYLAQLSPCNKIIKSKPQTIIYSSSLK